MSLDRCPEYGVMAACRFSTEPDCDPGLTVNSDRGVRSRRLAPVKRRDRALRLEARLLAPESRYRVSAWR